ncbi:MAG: hypothetical protein K8R36_06235 [Planctomycetales bacterium]|nr:hypothetical protein [Planctomycetales bacterium]
MSKSRGKSATHPASAAASSEKSSQPQKPSESAATSSPLPWCVAAAAAVVTVGYLLIFFGHDLLSQADRSYPRFLLFANLLTPDDLAKEWVDGSWRNYAPLDRWPIVLAAIIIFLMGAMLGAVGLLLSRAIRKTTLLDRYVLRIGVGLHLLSIFALVGGMLGIGFGVLRFLIQPIAFVVGMSCLQWLVRRLRNEPDYPTAKIHPPFVTAFSRDSVPVTYLHRIAECLLASAFVALSLCIVLGAMLPAWDFDVREYHLQVPKEWSEQGHITFLPHNVYGNMPLGAEMQAYGVTQLIQPWASSRYWWWGALGGKLLMACYGPVTALLLYSAGRRFWSELAGLTAAIVYLSSPWVIHVCVNGLNEAALGFYLIAALYAAVIGGKGRPCAGLAGFFAGAAASIKYTGVLFVVFPLALLMIWYGARWVGRWDDPRSPQKLRWRPIAAIFLLIAALSCGSWYLKNWILAGNPTYPLLSGVFGGKTLTPEKTARWNQAHRPPDYSLRNLADSAVKIGWKDTFQSPLIIPLASLGIGALAVSVRERRSVSLSTRHPTLGTPHSLHVLSVITLLLLFFLAAWWLFTHRLNRFLVPAIPLAALLAGAGVEYSRKKPLQYIVGGLMVIGLTYNVLLSASSFVGDNRWFVSLERLRTDEPKNQQDVSRVKPAHRWLNQNVKSEEAVLCVADAAVFDLEMPVFYNTCFDDCLLVNWTEGKSAAERKEEFRSRKVAYVYFDPREYERYISKGNYGYDPRFSPKLLDELIQQGVLKPPVPNAPPQIYPVAP